MSYAIVGFGEIGQALAHAFARKNIDVTVAMNALVPLEELDGLPSSAFVAKSFTGTKFVKGFNHLVAATLTADPIVEGGHRVVFLSSDDENAIAPVADSGADTTWRTTFGKRFKLPLCRTLVAPMLWGRGSFPAIVSWNHSRYIFPGRDER
jgi:predicted dinucleotide-binding enzyme